MEKITNLTFFLKFGNQNDTRLYFDHNIRCIVAFKLKDNNFKVLVYATKQFSYDIYCALVDPDSQFSCIFWIHIWAP